MTRPDAPPAAAPRFLVEPVEVIVEQILALDPRLEPPALKTLITGVVDTRPKQRRLAQALADDPGLLLSGEPKGPGLVETLIVALQQAGASGLARPRCAHCQSERPLTNTDRITHRRICSSCDSKARRAAGQCRTCGNRRRIHGRTADGHPLCRRCHEAAQPDDSLSDVHRQLVELGTGLDDEVLRAIAAEVLPHRSQQVKLVEELTAAPERLRMDPAAGSPRLILLVEALHWHGARDIALPVCPFCGGDERPLRFRREERRCCRYCYQLHRHERCSRCGRHDVVATRAPAGLPVCSSCHKADPINHENCTGCGRPRPIIHRDDDGARCASCWHGTPAICSQCGELKPCHGAKTPRCEHCVRKARATCCSRCGKRRIVSTRTSDGDPLCGNCSRPQERCVQCGLRRRVKARTDDGAVCRSCWPKRSQSFRHCVSCGCLDLIHHHGLCRGCAALRALHAFLGVAAGAVPATIAPVVRTLSAQDPARLLHWLDNSAAAQVLQDLAESGTPVTHAALDAYMPSKAVQFLRAALVNNGVLENRDEPLVALERWLVEVLSTIDEPADRQVLRGFATWHRLHRLRAKAQNQRGTTSEQAREVKREVVHGRELIDWLRARGSDLGSCTQDDIDRFLVEGPLARQWARPLLVWATAHRYAPRHLSIPSRENRPPYQFLADDERWNHARRLINEEQLPPADRLAGLLLLLFAQPVHRISQLSVTDIDHREGQTRIALGKEPLVLPPPLDGIAESAVTSRASRMKFGHHNDHPWLFPGGTPGRPISNRQLAQRLRKHGVLPRAARNTALIDLTAQLPAAVLSNLLGVSPDTADTWSRHANARYIHYAGDVVHRDASAR